MKEADCGLFYWCGARFKGGLTFAILTCGILVGVLDGQSAAMLSDRTACNVSAFGAMGDGYHDDTNAINNCIDAAARERIQWVVFDKKTYLIRRRLSGSQGPAIVLRNGVSLNGQGCTLLLNDNCSYIGTDTEIERRILIDRDISIGDRVLHVITTNGLRDGAEIGIRLNDNRWDLKECQNFQFGRINEIIDSKTLELDSPLSTAMHYAITRDRNRSILVLGPANSLYSSAEIQNFHFRRTRLGNPEAGIALSYASNVIIQQIDGIDPGAGIVMLAYCNGIRVSDITCARSIALYGQRSKGRVINAWNSRNCIFSDISCENFEGSCGVFESYCDRVLCTGWKIVDNRHEDKRSIRSAVIMVDQNSQVDFQRLNFCGVGGEVLVDSGGTPAEVTIEGLNVIVAKPFKALDLNEVAASGLTYNGTYFGPLRTIQTEIHMDQKHRSVNVRIGDGLYHEVSLRLNGYHSPVSLRANGIDFELGGKIYSRELKKLESIGEDYGTPENMGSLNVSLLSSDSDLDLAVIISEFPRSEMTEEEAAH